MPTKADILSKLKACLAPNRFAHSLRVEKIAVNLARQYRILVAKASLAALLHDYARQYDSPQLLQQARKFGLKIDAYSRAEPKLLHGKLGALLAKRDFDITAKDVLAAIKQHTLGKPGMSKLAKIIYLADHLEEGRGFPWLRRLRRLAFRDLDQAVGQAAARIIIYLLRHNLPIHPGGLRTRNYYLFNL
ncbi:bis(5'-nucleosyl)-tetraphosphatase (symmetrical) YqeK [Candidatus Saganbacteria bacterium]|nr:bis(5'-nucleosyl)-tetraphosphatase (symmetrical) YqeK [Candidatus Saganbacteria bacterium]